MARPDPKYFDYAASTPPFIEASKRFAHISKDYYANPSSIHRQGVRARKMMNELKKGFCDLLHFSDGRLLLCSSATEANNTIIESHIHKYPTRRILIAEDTHESVWYAVHKYPAVTDVLKIDTNGGISLSSFTKAFSPETSLVCINHACNETGTVHDIEKMGVICQANNIKLLVDGTQAVGHIAIDMNSIPCDYYTFSAHKFGGFRSTGGILMRDDDFIPLIWGGRQEWNKRAGTENIAGLGAAVSALTKCLDQLPTETSRLTKLTHNFVARFRELVPTVKVNTPENSIPGFLSLSIPGYRGNEIVTALSLSGFSVSTGSACHASQVEPSRTILALGRSREQAIGTIRISMGYGTTTDAVDALLEAIVQYVQR